MSSPFGKLNPRPNFKSAPAPGKPHKPVRKPTNQATIVLIAYVAGAIAFLCLATVALHAQACAVTGSAFAT